MNRFPHTLTILLLVALILPAATFAAGERTVTIKGSDDMRFSVTTIEAAPGETLHLVLTTASTMPKDQMAHNFVLLAAGVDLNDFIMAAATARRSEYIPAAMQSSVLAATAMAGAGETVEVTFQAPQDAGTYPFVCTFPGHFAAGMQGTLIVK